MSKVFLILVLISTILYSAEGERLKQDARKIIDIVRTDQPWPSWPLAKSVELLVTLRRYDTHQLQEQVFLCIEQDSSIKNWKSNLLWFGVDNDLDNVVTALAHRGADINAVGRFGRSPVAEAASLANIKTLKALLSAGADLRIKNKYDSSPLHSAAIQGSAESIGILCSYGADIAARDTFGRTPLIAATENPTSEALLILIKCGSLVDAQDDRQETALYKAAMQDKVEMVRALLMHKANPDIANKSGKTARSIIEKKWPEFLR